MSVELRRSNVDHIKEGFRKALNEIRALTLETNSSVFVPRLINECAKQGVAVVILPAPKGCPASGATRWISQEKAMLLLTLRYKTNDVLWFTFFHEAAHLVLHGKKLLVIEEMKGLDKKLENEADRFARDILISPIHYRRLEQLPCQPSSVRAHAKEIGIAPGIVVGRMQKEGLLPWSHLNGLKVHYEWVEDQKI